MYTEEVLLVILRVYVCVCVCLSTNEKIIIERRSPLMLYIFICIIFRPRWSSSVAYKTEMKSFCVCLGEYLHVGEENCCGSNEADGVLQTLPQNTSQSFLRKGLCFLVQFGGSSGLQKSQRSLNPFKFPSGNPLLKSL